MLMKYATPCGNGLIILTRKYSFMTCKNSHISSRFTFMSNRAIVLHKQTIYTQMLMKYATPCRNNPTILTRKYSFMTCKNLTSKWWQPLPGIIFSRLA